jgi:putative DNA primase/helicase
MTTETMTPDQAFATQSFLGMLQGADKPPKAGKKPKRPRVNGTIVRDTLAALKARNMVPGTFELPGFLNGDRRDVLPVTNGLLDVATGELLPHTPEFFSTVCLPYPHDPAAARCPILDRALALWFGGDAERNALLQEWVGYLLTRSTDAQAFLVLIGDGGGGKSAASAMVEATIGTANCSYLPWQQLSERFQMFQTLGKLLNLSDDIGEFDRSSEGVLKWFVAGKPITFERKNKDPFDAKPTARLMLSCNQPPRFSDRSDGVWRRMLLLPFDAKIAPADRVPGMDKAEWWIANANMSAVLRWALEGLQRLRAANYRFTVPARSQAVKSEIREGANPVLLFLEDNVTADAASPPLKVGELYTAYREWCLANGFKALSSPNFSTEVKRAIPSAEGRKRKVDGSSERYWFGLRLAGRPAPQPLRVDAVDAVRVAASTVATSPAT